jgi:hypothetical protein
MADTEDIVSKEVYSVSWFSSISGVSSLWSLALCDLSVKFCCKMLLNLCEKDW